MRIEPPASDPVARGTMPLTTAAAEPPLDPPGVLDVCFAEVERCDCMIVAGTSATVYPAASFPSQVRESGGSVIEANPNETPITGLADVVLRSPTGEALPRIVERVKELKG